MKDHLPPNTIKQPFDVFLSHNSKDKSAVEALASRLTDEAKLQVWLDKWHLIPGEPWQEEIERALDQAHTCAVFLGPNEFGGWHHEEMRAALDQRVADRTRKFRVIPVLLPGATMPDRSKLPAFLARLTWVDFRQGLEDAEAFHRLVAGIRGIVPGRPEGGAMPANVECPYRGLEVFDEEHARFFFGREAMTQHLVEALRPTRFLCVLGPSGSGKSSLARAGLLPLLRAGQLPGSRNWQYLVFKPGAHPIEELALSLAALQTVQDQISAADQLINNFKTTETALHLFARLWLRNHAPDTRLFLLVDQFEEVFTLCQDATEREQFIKNLRYAGTIEGGRTVIVPTMRADFLNRAAESPDLAELLSTHQFIVNPMEPGELRRAIEEPALLAGLRFEPGLVERILSDVGHEPGALPLLEHALRELFEKRNRENVLTMQAYEQSGGVQGALAQKAETIYARFKPEQQTILRRVMLRLTQPGEGTADTRRRAAQYELWNRAEERAAVEQVIHTLADERLLTTSRDAGGEEQLDVAHEALIRGWPRVGEWINEDREGLRLHHRLSEDVKEWQKRGEDESFLYRGLRLGQALEWRYVNLERLNKQESEFLDASQEERELEDARKEAQRNRSLRIARGVALIITLLLITAVSFGWYVFQTQDSNQKLIYDYDLKLAKEALDNNNYNLAIELLDRYLSEPGSNLYYFENDSSDRAEKRKKWEELYNRCHNEVAKLDGHTNGVRAVAYAPDGKMLASGSDDESVRCWKANTSNPWERRELVTLNSHLASVGSIAFAPDGKTLLATTSGLTVNLWEITNMKEPSTRQFIEDSRSVAFAPNGKIFVLGTVSIDFEIVTLWELGSGQKVAELKDDADTPNPNEKSFNKPLSELDLWAAHQQREERTRKLRDGNGTYVYTVAFAPSGKLIASGGSNKTLKLWDVQNKKRVMTFPGHNDAVWSVAFAPDGTMLASSSSDRTVRLWDVQGGKELATLLGHSGAVRSVAFAPDGQTLASGSDDWTVKLWDVPSKKELTTLHGHAGEVTSVAFAPDGQTLASGSRDKTVRLWRAAKKNVSPHSGK